ncbi:glycosyl hydrolase family 71 protein [Diplocarpon rosae]|nr:glycosyl hydrolase family 71 protein [Diplocarpon rosae]
MKLLSYLGLVLGLVSQLDFVAAQRYAFAHVVVGNSAAHTQETWAQDITLARNVGFDAFVLNIAYPDANIAPQVAHAFAAAEAAGADFKLFFAFDYLGGGERWPSTGEPSVVSYLNMYKSSPAYFLYNDVPFVSTFEGTSDIDAWAPGGVIRSAVGGIWFVPDWTSLGPAGFAPYLENVEGAFNWDMWPVGASNVTTELDQAWTDVLGSKSYMMGLSPWFFHSADSPKKWVWRGDDSWADRWTQAIDFGAPFLQSNRDLERLGREQLHRPPPLPRRNPHRLGSLRRRTVARELARLPALLHRRVQGHPPPITRDQMQYWYRPAPAAAGSTCGVVGGDTAQDGVPEISPNDILTDAVFFSALLTSAAQVHVQIGVAAETVYDFAAGLTHARQSFSGQTGVPRFWVTREGVLTGSGNGSEITAAATLAGGCTNYNPWVGSW